MAIKIEMLRAYCAVAQSGNLAEAAERLGRTQSALSMTLKQLEAHLGQRLFLTDRKNRLTALGAYVYDLAQEELAGFDAMVAAIEARAQAPQGLLRVAAVPSVAARLFAGLGAVLGARFPAVELELRDMESGAVIEAVTRGQVEIGIATAGWQLRGATQEALFTDAFGLICARGHPLARAERDPGIGEVLEAGLIWNALCEGITAPGFEAARGRARLVAHNTLTLMAMLRAGELVSVLPRSVAAIDGRALVFRPIAGLSARRVVHLLVREEAAEVAYVAEAAGWLRAQAVAFTNE